MTSIGPRGRKSQVSGDCSRFGRESKTIPIGGRKGSERKGRRR